MESDHTVFIEEGPCEVVQTDNTEESSTAISDIKQTANSVRCYFCHK